MRSLSICCCIASLLLACGSSTPKTEDPVEGGGVQVSDAMPQETPEQKFARQQADAVNKMCQRVTDCAIEDAKQEMSPEDLADLESKMDQILPKAIADCEGQYVSAMSPRQLGDLRSCLGEATECSVFGECIATALSPK
jgi:hypothetical protein